MLKHCTRFPPAIFALQQRSAWSQLLKTQLRDSFAQPRLWIVRISNTSFVWCTCLYLWLWRVCDCVFIDWRRDYDRGGGAMQIKSRAASYTCCTYTVQTSNINALWNKALIVRFTFHLALVNLSLFACHTFAFFIHSLPSSHTRLISHSLILPRESDTWLILHRETS